MTMPHRHILFADDDVLTQWIMTDVLTQAGFTVVSACRVSEAVRLLEDLPDFDLLLAAVDLPDDRDGVELGEHWRNACPGRPVIYTGPQRSPAITMLQHHEHFIEKPMSAAKLLRLIDWALENEYFRPSLSAVSRRSQHVH